MDAREDLPRVSVGSVQDWQKVRSNYKEAALSQMKEHMANSKALSREKDAILAHLDHLIDRSFALAQPNLRVNGNNFESFDENGREMDPFDEALDRRIWSLADTRLQWHKRIAETRRTIPTEVETTISALLERHRELDAVLLPVGSEDFIEDDLNTDENVNRQHRVEQSLQKTSALANELNQTMDQQQERGERVKTIAVEVKSLKL